MDHMTTDLFIGFQDAGHLLRVPVRLVVALVLGGVLGWERQIEHKTAGVRTHMLVSLGAALFTLVPLEGGLKVADLSRVIQGLATGVGFLGAGTILKSEHYEIRGLNTAANIWLAAATGMAVGAGWLYPALVGVSLAWIGLYLFHPRNDKSGKSHQPGTIQEP